MSSSLVVLFGYIESAWINKDGDSVVLVGEESGVTSAREWKAMPRKYEINISQAFLYGLGASAYIKPSFTEAYQDPTLKDKALAGKIVSFSVRVGFYQNGRISGFVVEKILSLDLERDVQHFLSEIYETKRAASTDLPVCGYFQFVGNRIEGGRLKYNDVQYELAFSQDELAADFLKNIDPDSLERLDALNNYGWFGRTLVNIYKNDVDYLSTRNIGLIFDRFYRPIRGLGWNQEHSDGEKVFYTISERGDVVHTFMEDKVKYTEDRSRDRSSIKHTIVLRLGDRLPENMVEFLKEPVKGHYKPVVLF